MDQEYKFKTNINCGGCIKAVSSFLNEEADIQSWEVDTDNPDKVLTVKTNTLSPHKIMTIVGDAGFDIEELAEI